MRILAIAALLTLASCIPEDPATPSGKASFAVNAKGLLKRGMNLGDALEAPTEGEWGRVLTETIFADVAAAGFDHVRIPISFSSHAGATAPFTIDEKFFARVDWALDQAQRRGLAAVIDLHQYKELHKDPDGNAERFIGLWKQIAARYKDRPPSVYYELLNEPTDKLTAPIWNALLVRTLAAVRAADPTRKVIIDSVFWAAAKELPGLEIPDSDPNLIASFHMYQPILFTHQGLTSFMDPEYGTIGVVFPGPPKSPISPVDAAQNKAWVADWFRRYNETPAAQNPSGPSAVAAEFEFARNYVARTKRTLYMGEFGAGEKVDPVSRAAWLHMVRAEADKQGIGWAYWDDGGLFKIYDDKSRTWNDTLKAALLAP